MNTDGWGCAWEGMDEDGSAAVVVVKSVASAPAAAFAALMMSVPVGMKGREIALEVEFDVVASV